MKLKVNRFTDEFNRQIGRWGCFLRKTEHFSLFFNLRPDTDQIRSKYGAGKSALKGRFGAVL
jgi:hypothetical protein